MRLELFEFGFDGGDVAVDGLVQHARLCRGKLFTALAELAPSQDRQLVGELVDLGLTERIKPVQRWGGLKIDYDGQCDRGVPLRTSGQDRIDAGHVALDDSDHIDDACRTHALPR